MSRGIEMVYLMSDSDRIILRTVAEQLEKWASASLLGGWSTHQVEPQRDLAKLIYAHLGRTEES